MQGLHFSELLPKITSSGRVVSSGFFKQFSVLFFVLTLTLFSPLILETVFAQTTTTRLFLSGPTSSAIIGIVGGYTMPVNVNVYDITTTSGLAAFTFKISYNPNLVSIADADNNYVADAGVVSVGPFLGSSGKEVRCSDGYIDIELGDSTKKYLTFTCGTLGATPAAPTGGGVLATINFRTGNTVSYVPLSFVTAQLADNTANANLIQNTTTNGTALIAKCANVAGNDSTVTIADILYVVQKFGTTDLAADLDGSGTVSIVDVLIAVAQYGKTC